MKLSIRSILFVAIFFAPVAMFGQSTFGLVAHWPFSGNASDNTGKGHNGTMNNVTATAGKSGVSNTAIRFAGASNSYITIPYQPDLNLTNYTFCAVLKPEGFYTNTCQISMIMARGVDHGYPGSYFLSLTENVFDSSCTTFDTNRYVFTCGGGPSNYPYHYSWADSPTVHTNQWYCVIGTFDGTAFRIYVNGDLRVIAPPQVPVPIGTSTDGLSIGANIFGNASQYPYWFKGVMDDLRIYNRVLTASEIANYCNPVGDGGTDTTASVIGIEQNISVAIAPNPNSGNFSVHGILTSPTAAIDVYNTVGQLVYRKVVAPVQNAINEHIELPVVADGVYIVKVTAGVESKTYKMLIRR
ncbi:LamG-like jellyroll fold domain-containing protein [Polluticoccus soli]|uniref:LamG-like jellyroll fold domain-containing protein n=1 Tax=Polluticoccus soli TaxID=3034150 RepID=UPI0023E1D18C|nr:LamG-like jellyroll fold domain-containing protein [Flavipsychrobacter sp. JY13-12]